MAGDGCRSVVEYLSSIHETLGSISRTMGENKNFHAEIILLVRMLWCTDTFFENIKAKHNSAYT